MSTTKLHLEFPDFNERYFDCVEIDSQIVKIKSNSEDIIIQKSINREHFNEEIKLSNKDDYVKYKIDLCRNSNNNYYCLISSKNDCALQIYNYDKENSLESINVTQKNASYNLTLCDSIGLKYCKRFGVINCTKDCLDKKLFDIQQYIKEGNYIINRFHKKISVEKMKEPKYYEIDFKSLPAEEKDYLLNLESKFNEIYNSIADDDKIDNDIKNSKLGEELTKILNVKYKFKELIHLQHILAGRRKLAYNINEYKICYGYIFMAILTTLEDCKSPYILYTMLLHYLNDLKEKISHSYDILRIMLWYNSYYLEDRIFTKKINNIFKNQEIQIDGKLIEKLNGFRLVFPNSCKKNTPYKNCYDFLYKFIDSLDEDSYLLEILYLLDSDTSSNRLFKNVRIFQLSLLSLSQIKEHLKLIIPDIVIRKLSSKSDWCNADHDPVYGTLECFEGTLYNNEDIDFLNSILINNEDTQCKYSLPLIMVFLHELFGHAKHRLDNNHSLSPTHFYNPYANYQLLYHCVNGESGRIFEYYISDDIEIIKYLKFALIPNKELMDIKLWVASDLKQLRLIVKQKIKDNKFSCQKEIKDFPKKEYNIEPIPANGEEKDNCLSDQTDDIYYYDKNSVGYPHDYLLRKNTKIYCI